MARAVGSWVDARARAVRTAEATRRAVAHSARHWAMGGLRSWRFVVRRPSKVGIEAMAMVMDRWVLAAAFAALFDVLCAHELVNALQRRWARHWMSTAIHSWRERAGEWARAPQRAHGAHARYARRRFAHALRVLQAYVGRVSLLRKWFNA